MFSQRQSTQLEEMESLMNKLTQPSSRSRNLSSERQANQLSIQFSIESSRYRNKNHVQSYSVEKSLNLSSQNQKVESLIASWKQQKNTTSQNSSSNNVQPVSQFESQGRPSNRPQIIIEEDLLFGEEAEQQPLPQSNKIEKIQQMPSTTRPHANSIKEQKSFEKKKNVPEKVPQKKAGSGQTNYTNTNPLRPQTTKMHTQIKSSPQVHKEPVLYNPMKASQVDASKYNHQYNGANSYSNITNNNASKNKSNNLGQYQKIVKKGSQNGNCECQLDSQCIPDLLRLKEQIISAYLKQSRALISSQQQIVKNFDEIVQILKQDFSQ